MNTLLNRIICTAVVGLILGSTAVAQDHNPLRRWKEDGKLLKNFKNLVAIGRFREAKNVMAAVLRPKSPGTENLLGGPDAKTLFLASQLAFEMGEAVPCRNYYHDYLEAALENNRSETYAQQNDCYEVITVARTGTETIDWGPYIHKYSREVLCGRLEDEAGLALNGFFFNRARIALRELARNGGSETVIEYFEKEYAHQIEEQIRLRGLAGP